ncbi:MAG: hypothetical protein ACLQUZ_14605 [Rhizomicrobium sp.]
MQDIPQIKNVAQSDGRAGNFFVADAAGLSGMPQFCHGSPAPCLGGQFR